MRTLLAAAALLVTASCSTSSASPDPVTTGDGAVTLSGTVEVLAPGSRSETIILQVDATGEVVALVGEGASGLRGMPGTTITVTGFFTEAGWSVDPGIRKLEVTDVTAGEGPNPQTGTRTDRYGLPPLPRRPGTA